MSKVCKYCGKGGVGEQDDLHEKCAPKYLEYQMTTPSKEPSVDERLDEIWDTNYPDKGKSHYKALMLAHALSLLPEKRAVRLESGLPYSNIDIENQGFNAATKLMEQSLREGYK